MYKEYQIVKLTHPVGGLNAGTVGTIVMAYPAVPPGYEVEFVGSQGTTLAVLTLHDEDLESAPEYE